MHQIIMPRLGPTMNSALITEWKRKEGDTVAKGEVILVVETEKVSVEVQSPATGKLGKILSKEGTECQVGDVIGVILSEGETIPADIAQVPAAKEERKLAKPTQVSKSVTGQRFEVSPLARKLAEEANIDLSTIQGSGPGGRISASDVQLVIEQKSTEKGTFHPKISRVVKLTPIRKTISERLVKSSITAAQVTLSSELDAKNFVAQFGKIKTNSPLKLTYTDLFVKIVGYLLRNNDLLNSSLEGDEIKIYEDINIGIATSVEGGLLVPVIHKVQSMSIAEISKISRDLVGKARSGTLSTEDVSGGTFTITNLGMYKVDEFTPIINPPQTAILGVGRMKEKPVVENGQVVIHPTVTFSLTFDHRVIDGAVAAKFLDQLDKVLQESGENLPEVYGASSIAG